MRLINNSSQDTRLSSPATSLRRDNRGRILREAVEYCVVDHCNLRCAGCDHWSPHLTTRFADPQAFAEDIAALSQVLHVRVLRLLGGEPLLHPALASFVGKARDAQIADEIMLWTNGLLLHEVQRDLLEQFDVVRVSVYPNVKLPVDLDELAKHLAERSRTRLDVIRINRFQHQLLNEPIEDPKLVRRTYLRCKEAHSLSCHSVYEGRYYKCAKAPILERRLAGRGLKIAAGESDGVSLRANPNLGEELARYLASHKPLVACTWCLGTDGTSFPHHQLNKEGIRTERGLGTGPAPFASPARMVVRDLLHKSGWQDHGWRQRDRSDFQRR